MERLTFLVHPLSIQREVCLDHLVSVHCVCCFLQMKAAKCSKAQSPAGNSKKPRAMFSPHQLYKLDESFVANNFPKAKKREEIASELQMCPHSVQVLSPIVNQIANITILENVVGRVDYIVLFATAYSSRNCT